jgi:hypothetical protein
MENIGWPPLFGYDMRRFFSDPEFMLEQELRQKVFWADNSEDDWSPAMEVDSRLGHYFDMTLFGGRVEHDADGVPQFGHHPVQDEPDLAVIEPFDFHTSGIMPRQIEQHEAMRELVGERFGGELEVLFPQFNRGPLDICVQLRGYKRFVADTAERPDFAREFLALVADERARWRRERAEYLGGPPEEGVRVDDDWVNVPFITPGIFRDFVAPVYARIRRNEGPVVGFHTCGNFTPVAADLLGVLPELEVLDVSGWNDLEELDRLAPPELPFHIQFKNALVLTEAGEAHRRVLEGVARLAARRPVTCCAQAIVDLCGTYEKTLRRMNRFIALAREAFAAN